MTDDVDGNVFARLLPNDVCPSRVFNKLWRGDAVTRLSKYDHDHAVATQVAKTLDPSLQRHLRTVIHIT
jgi:hypothetical protein